MTGPQHSGEKVSSAKDVRELYETSADSYATMMDSEIDLPLYAETLSRLCANLEKIPGPLVDTSCGSGHMLSMYREKCDDERPLIGVDLSPSMVGIAAARLGSFADILLGDMCELPMVATGSAAAAVSFFAIHHLDPEGVSAALCEWHRVLRPGGQLLIAAWEGVGAIDYGDSSDVVALRYRSDELTTWGSAAGFAITRCVVEPVEEMQMDAIYLDGVAS